MAVEPLHVATSLGNDDAYQDTYHDVYQNAYHWHNAYHDTRRTPERVRYNALLECGTSMDVNPTPFSPGYP